MQQSAALALARGIQANDPVAIAQFHLLDEAAIRHEGAREFLTLVVQMGEAERKAMFARMKEGIGHAIGHPISNHDGTGATERHGPHVNWPGGLDRTVELHPLSRVAGLASTDHWALRTENKGHSEYFDKPEEIIVHVEPRIPSADFKDLGIDKWGRHQGHYDSRIAAYVPSDDAYGKKVFLQDGSGFTEHPTGRDNPDTIWRGLSYHEMQHIKATGQIQSEGTYNFTDQENQTFFSTGIDHARSYATGFAPVQFAPTFDRPGYIIGVRRPPESQIATPKGTLLSHEVGVHGSIPASQIIEVHEARPYHIRGGDQELRLQYDGSYSDGSGGPPNTAIGYRPLDVASLLGQVQQELVLQAQSSRERYIHWLLDQKNGIGRPIGHPAHHEWLEPFTGPHGPLSSEHAAAAEHLRAHAAHAQELIETHTAWHSKAFQAHLEAHPDHSPEQIIEAFHGKVELKNGKKVKGPSFLAKSRADERAHLKALERELGVTVPSATRKDATRFDQYPHHPTKPGMLPTPGAVADYSPEMQFMMHDQLAFMGISVEDLQRNSDAWLEEHLKPWDLPTDLERHPDPLSHIEDNQSWYKNVTDWVTNLFHRYGISSDKILGATAKLSPLRFWGESNPARGDAASWTNRGATIALLDLIHHDRPTWVARSEVDAYNEKYGGQNGQRVFPPPEITLHPTDPTQVPVRSMTGLEIAYFTRNRHTASGQIIPEFKTVRSKRLDPVSGEMKPFRDESGEWATEQVPVINDHTGKQDFERGLGVINKMGPVGIGQAIDILRGRISVIDGVVGPKIQSFNNNILDPTDPFVTTVDTWSYRSLLVHPDGTALPIRAISPVSKMVETHTIGEWERMKITPQALFQSQPKLPPYASDTGLYPIFADVLRETGRRYGLLPSRAQAAGWVAIQRNFKSPQGTMRAEFPQDIGKEPEFAT